MSTALLNLRGLTRPEIITAVTAVKTGITDNPSIFTTPSPTMALLGTKLTAASAALAACTTANDAAREAAIVCRAAMADLIDTVELLVPYVQTVTGGDEAKIVLAAMGVRKTPEPVGELPAPANVRARNNGQPTTVVLNWGRVYGGFYYVVDMVRLENGVPVGAFAPVAQSGRAGVEITNLIAATEYQFRVRAVGTAGPGPWSNTVTKVTGA